MAKYAWAVVGIGFIIIAGALYLVWSPAAAPNPADNLPIIDPSQQGQPTYNNATPDLIIVQLPFPGAVVGREFSVRGMARGYWFFEASFPVFLFDPDGNEIAVGIAQPEPAGTEWMTENMIGFKADLQVPATYSGPATLVVRNDNPSGLPENDKSVSFPITVEY